MIQWAILELIIRLADHAVCRQYQHRWSISRDAVQRLLRSCAWPGVAGTRQLRKEVRVLCSGLLTTLSGVVGGHIAVDSTVRIEGQPHNHSCPASRSTTNAALRLCCYSLRVRFPVYLPSRELSLATAATVHGHLVGGGPDQSWIHAHATAGCFCQLHSLVRSQLIVEYLCCCPSSPASLVVLPSLISGMRRTTLSEGLYEIVAVSSVIITTAVELVVMAPRYHHGLVSFDMLHIPVRRQSSARRNPGWLPGPSY